MVPGSFVADKGSWSREAALTGGASVLFCAAAKLAHYGLAACFADGGYAEGEEDRAAIARGALAVARRFAGDSGAGRVFVIGDTPCDIRCGKAIGARLSR